MIEMNLGPHTAFIIAAYGLAALVIAGLICWVWVDHKLQRRALDDLESRGIKRRSGEAGSP